MHYRSEQTVYTPKSRKTVKLHRISIALASSVFVLPKHKYLVRKHPKTSCRKEQL